LRFAGKNRGRGHRVSAGLGDAGAFFGHPAKFISRKACFGETPKNQHARRPCALPGKDSHHELHIFWVVGDGIAAAPVVPASSTAEGLSASHFFSAPILLDDHDGISRNFSFLSRKRCGFRIEGRVCGTTPNHSPGPCYHCRDSIAPKEERNSGSDLLGKRGLGGVVLGRSAGLLRRYSMIQSRQPARPPPAGKSRIIKE